MADKPTTPKPDRPTGGEGVQGGTGSREHAEDGGR